MVLDDFFIKDTIEINWDFVWKLPHFCEMRNTQQNPRWHMEGSAKDHTQLMCENMFKFVVEHYSQCTLERQRLLMLSALFHDIGKPSTTFLGEKDNQWHSYGHENVGEKLTREMLWDWPLYQREYICNMVKYHMSPLFFKKQKNPEMAVRKMVSILPYSDLYYLKMADLLGALQDPETSTKEKDIETLKEFYEIGEKWSLEYLPFTLNAFKMDDNGFALTSISPDYKEDKCSNPTVYVMIGLPGAGKNTVIENNPSLKNAIVLSRDDIRIELGYCSKDEKIVGTDKQERKVTEIFDARMRQALEDGKDVVVNNINLSLKRRKALNNQWAKYKPYWRYIYVEAPTFEDNLKRRKGQISHKVFRDMIQRFDFPDIFECDFLTIIKQSKNE